MNTTGAITTYGDGWVRISGMSPDSKRWRYIWEQYFKTRKVKSILEMTSISFEMNLPIFVLLSFGRINYFINPTTSFTSTYTPTSDEIGSKQLQNNQDIVDSMSMNLQALLANRESYIVDGCNSFVANTVLPISTYVNVVSTASLLMWAEYCKVLGFSNQISIYQGVIFNLIKGQLPDIEYILKDLKNG